MKVTVCELSDDQALLAAEWRSLVAHTTAARSDFVLLPEMPFYPWWMSGATVDESVWNSAVASHQEWKRQLAELQAPCVGGSFPAVRAGERINEGFLWEDSGYVAVHEKHFLPDEAGFHEAAWYSRGNGEFQVAKARGFTFGFLICTELWSFEHAQAYGRQGAHLIASPRASVLATRDKWLVGGRAAAIVSGAFSISSNRRGASRDGTKFGGQGWMVDPDGKVLGVTSETEPFLTIDVELDHAVRAKGTYPRDVFR